MSTIPSSDTARAQALVKPPYRVPTMREVNAIPDNGYRVVSTFAGCGGSSLGYRMAGYRVLWANEFIPVAADCYAANARAETIVDRRDIRQLRAQDILDATHGVVPDILDGSPPCASFSTAGKRNAHWGKVKDYSDTQQRTDDLFFEFARILGELRPRVFVAENVSGLVKGVAKGYFKQILRALHAQGYRVSARLLDAQWLGVPQARQRIIFVGVRDDLDALPAHPDPLPYFYSVRDALPQIARVKHGGAPDRWLEATSPSPSIVASGATLSPTAYLSGGSFVEAYVSTYQGARSLDLPAPTVLTHGSLKTRNELAVAAPGVERRRFTIDELRAVCSFPADFILPGTFAQQWERLGRAVPPLMMRAVAETVRDKILAPLDAAQKALTV